MSMRAAYDAHWVVKVSLKTCSWSETVLVAASSAEEAREKVHINVNQVQLLGTVPGVDRFVIGAATPLPEFIGASS